MLEAVPWPVYLLFLAAILLPLGFKLRQQVKAERQLARAGLSQVHRMAWPEFARYMETLFNGLGYQVERVQGRTDTGADLILQDGTGRRTAVNARHFRERVDKPALQEAAAGAENHNCQDSLIISVIGFTNGAIAMAEEMGALLWDGEDLADSMEKVRSRPSFQPREPFRSAGAEVAAAAAGPALSSAQAPARTLSLPTLEPEPAQAAKGPPCPVCGTAMESKIAAGREIWLCARFPRCNGAELKEKPQ